LADPWAVEPRLLSEAAKSDDPTHRMALAIAHFIAGYMFYKVKIHAGVEGT